MFGRTVGLFSSDFKFLMESLHDYCITIQTFYFIDNSDDLY